MIESDKERKNRGKNMQKKGHLILSVDPGSIADQLELAAGDRVMKIDGQEL